MNRTRLREILFAAMLLSANGFPTRAFASCSSYISGANEATVTCTAATDAFTIGWFAYIDSTNSVVDVLYHVGPSTWGNDLWDWGNGSQLPPGATIRIAGLNGGSVTIGVQDESYATADHIPVNVILETRRPAGEYHLRCVSEQPAQQLDSQ